jgi:hypothetical protein
MSPSVNLIATGRWFKGMKGAATVASPKNKINTRGDVTGGIWYSTDVEWDFEENFLSMAPVVSLFCVQSFGEMWEFFQRFPDNSEVQV